MRRERVVFCAAASAVPLPGLDWAVDAALLSRLVPEINAQFGLTPAQLDKLPHHKREQVQKAVGAIGSMLVGKFITRDLVVRAAKAVGMRMTAKQAVRYVPLAGQAVSAALTFGALKFVCEQHIQQCLAVARQLQLPAPAAA